MSTRADWCHAYARVTKEEYAVVRAQAALAGLSVSDFVRRCINGYLLEQGDDVPLLEEHSGDEAAIR